MEAAVKDKLLLLLKLGISFGLIAFVYQQIMQNPDIQKQGFFERFLSISPGWAAAALGIILVSHVLNIHQWKMLLHAQGICISYYEALKYFFVGLFFNSFMLGNAGGDVKKIYDIKKDYQSLGGGFTATVFDRLFGLFFLNGLSLGVGVLFFLRDEKLAVYILPSFWVFLGFVALLCALFSRRIGALSDRILRRMKVHFIADKLASLREHFYKYRKFDLWVKLILLSSVIQICRVLVHYFVALGLGVDLPISYFLYFIPIIAVVSAIPISFGGFGPREAVAQHLFAKAGVSVMDSVVIQIIAYLIALAASLCGVVFFLKRKKNHG